jgi:glycosyltransferase involved in cell wall biosynthesis
MSTPVVSVVIIFLNADAFLEAAIQSVHDQSFAEWELILVDDGSRDASASIARKWTEREPHRIRLLQHPGGANCGMSASRNLGLQHATGQFVAYLDADDVWERSALRERVDEMRRYPQAAMIFGPALYWWSWSASSQHRDRQQPLEPIVDQLHQPPALVRQFVVHSELTPSVGTVLYRRDCLVALGGSDAAFRSMYEDQVLAVKFALHHPIFVSRSVICRYRQHAESACAVSYADGSHTRERLRFLAWVEQYMTSCGIRDAALSRVLRQQTRKAAAGGTPAQGWRGVAAKTLPAGVVDAVRRRLYGDA